MWYVTRLGAELALTHLRYSELKSPGHADPIYGNLHTVHFVL